MSHNPTGSPLRTLLSGGTGLLRSLFPAAAAYLSPRVSRALILRMSALLFVRCLLMLLPIPIDAGISQAAFSALSNVALSSVGLAAFAGYFDYAGPLGAIGARLFAPAESPFVGLWALFVVLVGCVLGLIEACVVVFVSMEASRALVARMEAAGTPGEYNTWRNAMAAAAAGCYAGVAASAWGLLQLSGQRTLPAVVGAVAIGYFAVPLLTDQSNILDAASLTLYTSLLLLAGAIEERDAHTPSRLFRLVSSATDPVTPQTRALLLVGTLALGLLALTRAPRIARTVMLGHDALVQEDAARAAALNAASAHAAAAAAHMANANAAGVPPLNLAPDQPSAPALAYAGGRPRWQGGLVAAVAVAAATFRTLVWARELRADEYVPAGVRAAQSFLTLVVFVWFLKIEANDEEAQARSQTAKDE